MLEIFYDGLSEISKISFDHSAGGSIHWKKTPEEAQELIDMVANNQSSIRNLEVQIGQLSKRIPEIPFSTLSSNTEVNLREECKALIVEAKAKPTEEHTTEELKEIGAHEEVPMHAPLQAEEPEEYSSSDEEEETKEEQIARFLAILMKMKASSSYAEALENEPPVLTKKLSALVQKKLLQKLPDPGSFLIPYTIVTITFEKALCDLSSSINLMPLSVIMRLRILEVQSAKISLEMVDKSLKRVYGMVDDVLVKVEDLYLPADFVIIDTGEDRDESIILRRLFLATAKALIDVEKGKLVL
nr:uncharacterized protein LOC112729908 [Arachis hypogaea]